jgi:hypothetical protein
MKHRPVNPYYNVYRLVTNRREALCVAVSKTFEPLIDQAVKTYGSIRKVPVEQTVRGIFMACRRNHHYNFDPEQPENDVVINQLRPYPSD